MIDENLQQYNFIHNDDIHLEHDGDGVNALIEVSIVSEGFTTVDFRQVSYAPLPIEVHSHTIPSRTF